jgi:hypothetical protein
MSVSRRIRGLVGTAITWGGIGALVGVPAFVAVMRPWPLNAIRWQRFAGLFAKWEAVAIVWGIAGGLTFALAFIALERSRRISQLSLKRVAAWGALAGAALPAILVWPLLGGPHPVYYGAIIVAGSLGGAVWARMSLVLARRAQESPEMQLFSGGAAAARDALHP